MTLREIDKDLARDSAWSWDRAWSWGMAWAMASRRTNTHELTSIK